VPFEDKVANHYVKQFWFYVTSNFVTLY